MRNSERSLVADFIRDLTFSTVIIVEIVILGHRSEGRKDAQEWCAHYV